MSTIILFLFGAVGAAGAAAVAVTIDPTFLHTVAEAVEAGVTR